MKPQLCSFSRTSDKPISKAELMRVCDWSTDCLLCLCDWLKCRLLGSIPDMTIPLFSLGWCPGMAQITLVQVAKDE